jgi:hypothetical protein
MAKRTKRRYGWFWAGSLVFTAGLLTYKLSADAGYEKGPPLATAVAVALSLPFTRRAKSASQGAIWGAGLGMAGALGVAVDMSQRLPVNILYAAALLAMAVNVFCCATAGGLFAYLASRRMER